MKSKSTTILPGLLFSWTLITLVLIINTNYNIDKHINYFNKELVDIKKANKRFIILIQNRFNLLPPAWKWEFEKFLIPLNAVYSDSLALALSHSNNVDNSRFLRTKYSDVEIIDELYKEAALSHIVLNRIRPFIASGCAMGPRIKLIRTNKDSMYLGTAIYNSYDRRTYLRINGNVFHPSTSKFNISVPMADSINIQSFTLTPRINEIGIDTIESSFNYHP